MELERLFPDHGLQQILGRLEVVPGPVEGFVALRLHLLVVEALKVGVLEALLHSVALLRIEYQHLAQEIQSHRVGLGIKTSPALLVALRQLADVLSRKLVTDEGHVLVRRGTQDGDSSLDLVEVVVTREEGCAAKQLRENAANGPDVERVCVMTGVEDDLGRSVPPGDHVLRQRSGRLLIASSETEVADFKVTVLIQQQVARLQITMDDRRAVDVKAATQQLIHEILAMVVRQILSGVNYAMHISLHEIRNNVDVLITSRSRGFLHINKANDILMIEELLKH